MPATARTLNPNSAITEWDSQAYVNSGVIAAAPCTLLTAVGSNKGAAMLYIMFFDSATVPADGAIPVIEPIPLPPGGTFNLNEQDLSRAGQGAPNQNGLTMVNGLSWAASTTAATKTVDATSSIWMTSTFA